MFKLPIFWLLLYSAVPNIIEQFEKYFTEYLFMVASETHKSDMYIRKIKETTFF